MVREWIKAAQAAGWVVQGVRGRSITLTCACHGCRGSREYLLESLDGPPPPCALDHVNGHSRPAFEGYQDLVAELRRRRVDLGLDQMDLGAAMGVPDGYVNKLESFARTASPLTLWLWAQAVGLRLTYRPAALPPATLKAIEDRQARPYDHNRARSKHGS